MKRMLYIFITILVIFNCSQDNAVDPKSDHSAVNLQIEFQKPEDNLNKINSQLALTSVLLRVTGPEMNEINTTLSLQGNQASGTVEVPKGPNRLFEVAGVDQHNNVLFSGQGTKSLNNDVENITIGVEWLPSMLNLNCPFQNLNEINFSVRNINNVRVTIGGEGLANPIIRLLNIQGNSATGSIEMPRGDKEISVLASVVGGPVRFDFFQGYEMLNLTTNSVNSEIPLAPILDLESRFAWHDINVFENWLYSDVENDIIVVGFDVSNYNPVYVKSIVFDELRWSGNPGPYKLILLDGWDLDIDLRFITDPIEPQADGLVEWNLVWDPPVEGIFDGLILAGFQYASNHGYPEIGFDNTDPDTSCFWYDTFNNSWETIDYGDFAITLVVQNPTGQDIILKPTNLANMKSKSTNRLKSHSF